MVAVHSLLRVGSTREALAYLDWLIDRVAHVPSAERLRPLYPLAGDEFLSEAVIPTLNGYRGSRPVRIGNLAEHQLQLDMFGPVVDLVHRSGGAGVYLTDRHWDLTRAIVDAVCSRWREPDHGIWEERRAPAHFVVSKVMCWTAVDRGIAIASSTGRPPPDEWIEARMQIKEEILREGWNPEIGSFSAAMATPMSTPGSCRSRSTGMLPPDDPRVIATVLRVERVLREGEVVFRYRHDDGFPAARVGSCSAPRGSSRRSSRSDASKTPASSSTATSTWRGRPGCCPRSSTPSARSLWGTSRSATPMRG